MNLRYLPCTSLCLVLFPLVLTAQDVRVVENPRYGPFQDSPGDILTFEEEATFGSEDGELEEILSWVQAIAVDDNGNVYLLEPSRIVAFDPAGRLLWSSGTQGQGPGEFQGPRGLAFDGTDRLITINQSGTRIDEFDLDGKYVMSTPVESTGFSRLSLRFALDDGTLVAHRTSFGKLGATIVLLHRSPEWSVSQTIEIDQTGDLEISRNAGDAPVAYEWNSMLAISHTQRYEYAMYDSSLNERIVVRRNVPEFTRMGVAVSGNSTSVREFSFLGPPVPLSADYNLTSGYWPTNVSDPDETVRLSRSGNRPEIITHRTMDLYDGDWNLLYSLENENLEALNLGDVMAYDKGGVIYTFRTAPFPQVVRYRVGVELP